MALGRTSRRIMLSFFFLIFFIVGAYLTIKMLGYVIDTKNMRLVKAGGIYVKFTPRTATLFLDGKKYPSSSAFLTNDIYVPGLSPTTHSVSLSLPGYYDWNKEFALTSGMVASSKNIILWPKKLTPEASSTDIVKFWSTKNGALVKDISGSLTLNNTVIKGTSVVLANEDSSFVVTEESGLYYFIDTNDASSSLNINLMFSALKRQHPEFKGSAKIQEIISHPFTRTKVIIATNTSLYILDVKKVELEQAIATNKLLAYGVSNIDLFAIDNAGTIKAKNLILNTQSEYPLHLSTAIALRAAPDSGSLLIKTGSGELFYFEQETQTLTKMGTSVSFFTFAPDSKRAAIIESNGMARILYLKDYEENEIRHKGETTTFRLEQAETPSSFTWMPFTQNYFLAISNGTLFAEEFDARSKRNIAPLASGVSQFSIHDKTLYVLNALGILTSYSLAQ